MYWKRPAKKSWPPCANPLCPEPMGGRPGGTGNVTPARLSGQRFGVAGVLCHECWTAAYEIVRRGGKPRRRIGRTRRRIVLPAYQEAA